MGRRSRKRAIDGTPTTRAERDAVRRERGSQSGPKARPGRPSIDEWPPAPWGKFPLSEILVFVGIALMVWGFIDWDGDGNTRLFAGILVAGLGGLELSLREHLAGYRSHSSLLAGAVAIGAMSFMAFGPGPHVAWVLAVVAVAVFAIAFYGLRELFKRRSGGLGFR